ncbi:MAG: hypothetical protein ACREWG_15490 [Gammaproteobacteria bacterium]
MQKRSLIMLFLAAALSGGYAWRAKYLDSAPVPPPVLPNQSLTGERHDKAAAGPGAETRSPEQLSSTSLSDKVLGNNPGQRPIDPPVAPSLEAEVEALEVNAKRAAAQVTRLSSEQVQVAMLDAIGAGDGMILNAGKNELMQRAKEGDVTAIQAIRSAIGQVPANLQTYLIGILGEIATPDALGSLIDILDETAAHNKSDAWYAALDAIGSIGRYRSRNVSPEQLAALIEDYFQRKSPDDPHLVAALGRGLSSLGTVHGVQRFLRIMDQQEASKAMTSGWVRTMTASLSELRNPEAVTLLEARLRKDPGLERATTRMAGAALAAMGDVRASEALLWWASKLSGGDLNQQALTWLSEVRDEKSLHLLLQAASRFQFRDPDLLGRITVLAKKIDEESTPRLVQ